MVSRGGKQVKNLPMQEIAAKFVYSRQAKMKNFHLEDEWQILWVEVFIVTFFESVQSCHRSKQ